MSEPYTHARWSLLLQNTVANIEKLSVEKGGEYAGDDDRLANFRRNAKALNLLPEQVWAVYAGKHWDSIQQWIKDLAEGKTRPRSESLTGRADDLIVYLILLKAMIEAREDFVPLVPSQIAKAVEEICNHQWHRFDRYTDTCVFCNSMRQHPGRQS